MKPKKLFFWLIFGDFSFTPSYALWVRPQSFAKLKVLWKYIIVVSFMGTEFPVVKLKSFKFLSHQFSIHETIPFGGSFGPNSPKYCPILIIFSPEVLFKERKSVNLRIFKKFRFLRKREIPNFTVFVQLWPPPFPHAHALPPGFSLKMAEIE